MLVTHLDHFWNYEGRSLRLCGYNLDLNDEKISQKYNIPCPYESLNDENLKKSFALFKDHKQECETSTCVVLLKVCEHTVTIISIWLH